MSRSADLIAAADSGPPHPAERATAEQVIDVRLAELRAAKEAMDNYVNDATCELFLFDLQREKWLEGKRSTEPDIGLLSRAFDALRAARRVTAGEESGR